MRQNGQLFSESSTKKNSSGNILTRSWARISGKKKRSERQSSIEEGTEVVIVEESSPSTSNGQQIPWKLADKQEKSKPFLNRGMDKFRKSLRKKFGSTPHLPKLDGLATSSSTLQTTTDDTIKTPWGLDEKAVRLGTCKFNVKYLGACEVYESRGVQVCEGALQHLKSKKRITKAILYISGDGLRVVDRETNRGLIVDQTIEKVSFCAPDRNNEKGFAYICREAATRRWMCNGFLTTKESGERVSHAVGCAFTICLEQKKKREAEQATAAKILSGNIGQSSKLSTDLNSVWDIPSSQLPNPSDSSNFAKNNLAYASFRRQLSISERKQDPQTAIVNEPLKTTPTRSTINESIAKPRPHANPAVFDRQGSFKVPNVPQAAFKRFNSLRTDLLSRPNLDSTRLLNTEPIYEGDEWPETSLSSNPLPISTSLQFNHISEGNKENSTNNFSNWVGISNPTCQSTPVHNFQNMSEGKTSPSKAEEWLEQTFRSLSVQNDSPRSMASIISNPNQIIQSESVDFLDFSSPTQSQSSNPQFSAIIPLTKPETTELQTNHYQLPPIMPTTKPIYDFVPGNFTTTDSATTAPSMVSKPIYDHVQNDLTTISSHETNQSDPLKTHSRKGSSTKRIIEYQILEEIDVPISPPRTTPALTTTKQELDAFGQPIFVPTNLLRTGPSISDPFDVKWSTEVLKSTTITNTDNRCTVTPINPFSSESAPVNV